MEGGNPFTILYRRLPHIRSSYGLQNADFEIRPWLGIVPLINGTVEVGRGFIKLIYRHGISFLFDLDTDPGELHNLASGNKTSVKEMESNIKRLRNEERGRLKRKILIEGPSPPKRIKDLLKPLGYL